MAQSAADELIEANAEVFDELRKELLTVEGVEADIRLLQKIQESGEYRELLHLTAGHYLKYEETRAQTALKVARIDSTFRNAFRDMSDFSVDGEVYNVDRRDKEPPKGSAFYYQMFGMLDGNRYEA